MKQSLIIMAGFAIASLVVSGNTSALTMADFLAICESTEKPCTEHPILQAYVGGSLDLIQVPIVTYSADHGMAGDVCPCFCWRRAVRLTIHSLCCSGILEGLSL